MFSPAHTPHAVDAADVRSSVHQTHARFEYLAANNHHPIAAVHYYLMVDYLMV